MKYARYYFIIVVMLFILSGEVFAQEPVIPGGKWRLGFNADSQNEYTPSIGYFMSDNLEIGASYSNTTEDQTTQDLKETREVHKYSAFLVYYMPLGRLLPYLSAAYSRGKIHQEGTVIVFSDGDIFFSDTSETASVKMLEYTGGVLYFVTPSSGINFSYSISHGKVNTNPYATDLEGRSVSAGYSFFF